MRLTPIRKTFTYGAHQVTLETGEMARQAHGAVVVSMDDTVVLCTVVGARQAKAGQDFLPLTCDYVEKTYAAGKIPGGFFKREGRPSEKETLTSRLIDRPIRPLFPEGFYNEVQVVAQVLSCNPEVDPDIPALMGVSAALTISGIPFNGPIGAARVGRINGEYVLNPTATQLKESQLNLVVAGTEHAVLMVESEAHPKRTPARISASRGNRRSSAIRCSTERRASTAAIRARCARSTCAWAFCPARTARRSSPAARPRRWS